MAESGGNGGGTGSNGSSYVHRIMRMRCSCGSIDNYININQDHGVLAGTEQQPLMNANDHISGENIMHFGNCSSDYNPERVARKAMIDFIVGGPFVPGVSDLMESLGLVSFKCKPKTCEAWENGNEKHMLDGAPALTLDSCLTCRYKGVITMVPLDEYPQPDNQTTQTTDEEEQTEEENTHVVEEETAAVIAEAMQRLEAVSVETPIETTQQMAAMVVVSSAPAIVSLNVLGTGIGNNIGAGREILWERALECPAELQEANYLHNQGIPFAGDYLDDSGKIIDQSKMGDYRMNNFSVPLVGSGAIAAYNVMNIVNPGNQKSFADVVYEMEPYGILNNAYGMMPAGVTDYMVRQGYQVGYAITEEEKNAADINAGIVLSVSSSGTHYAAFGKELGAQEVSYYNNKEEEENATSIVITVNKPEN